MTPRSSEATWEELVRAIAAGRTDRAEQLLRNRADLAHERASVGADRATGGEFFLEEIGHYLYAGDSALHLAAAGYRTEIVRILLELGADCAARNRRGAEPLHYAADTHGWGTQAQAATIRQLLAAGANPNATDHSGVAPLHRAVRTRSAAAVQALLGGGADPRRKNGSGSTPLHLAVQTTGRGGSGSPQAIEQQRLIIVLLLQAGASPTDRDGRGRPVVEAASPTWRRHLGRVGPTER